MTAVETATGVVGTSVKRKEDASLLRGRGTYVDNLTLPGTAYMAVVRSPYPHARINSVNLDAARSAEGVVAAFSGADLAGDWAGGLPCAWPVTEDIKMPAHFPLASEVARFQGDGVAVVVAESRALAKDAAELIEVDYEPLPSNADVAKALDDGTPLVHEDLGTNECYVWKLATDDLEAAIAAADVVVTRRYFQPRLIPNAIEPQGRPRTGRPDRRRHALVGDADPTHPALRTATRARHPGVEDPRHRSRRGWRLRLEDRGLRRRGPIAVAISRRLGRPVKWTEERAENYVATIHGRDVVHELTFAATRDGTITAVKSEAIVRDGRVPRARDARHPDPRRVAVLRTVRDPELQRDVHRRLHAHDAYRRVSRRRPARGDLRPRADDGRARRGARDGSGRASGGRTSSRSFRTRWRRA